MPVIDLLPLISNDTLCVAETEPDRDLDRVDDDCLVKVWDLLVERVRLAVDVTDSSCDNDPEMLRPNEDEWLRDADREVDVVVVMDTVEVSDALML